MFSTLLQTNFKFSFTFILLSANTFKLDQSKVLFFGEDFKGYVASKVIFRFCVKNKKKKKNFVGNSSD